MSIVWFGAGIVLGALIGGLLAWVEGYVNSLLGRETSRANFGTVNRATQNEIARMDADSAAQVLLSQEDKHQDEEATRARILRLFSIVVGTILAYSLQVDAAVLLDQAVPNLSSTINSFLNVSGTTLHARFGFLPESAHLTAGIILTGLGASAGSAFWHAQLGRLASVRKETEASARLMRRA